MSTTVSISAAPPIGSEIVPPSLESHPRELRCRETLDGAVPTRKPWITVNGESSSWRLRGSSAPSLPEVYMCLFAKSEKWFGQVVTDL